MKVYDIEITAKIYDKGEDPEAGVQVSSFKSGFNFLETLDNVLEGSIEMMRMFNILPVQARTITFELVAEPLADKIIYNDRV